MILVNRCNFWAFQTFHSQMQVERFLTRVQEHVCQLGSRQLYEIRQEDACIKT